MIQKLIKKYKTGDLIVPEKLADQLGIFWLDAYRILHDYEKKTGEIRHTSLIRCPFCFHVDTSRRFYGTEEIPVGEEYTCYHCGKKSLVDTNKTVHVLFEKC